MAVSRRLRFEILRRDNHTCRYCGASAPDVKLTVDHVVPEALGGSDDPSNLVTACAGCNGGKSSIAPDSPTVSNVAQDALRWSAAIRVAADEMLADLKTRDRVRQEFDDVWLNWGFGPEENRKPVPRPSGWQHSVDSFMAAGLPMPVLIDCLQKAMANKKLKVDDIFRYMCGIAWKTVTELQESARTQLGQGGAPGSAVIDVNYEAMYGHMVSHIFGVMWGCGSPADQQVLARRYVEAHEEDEDQVLLTEEGQAALALVSLTADIVVDFKCAADDLAHLLPDGVAAQQYSDAEELLVYEERLDEQLKQVDRGVLRQLMVAARATALIASPSHPEPERQEAPF